MQTSINLEGIERKIYSKTHKDGLIDIFLGIVFLQFSIAPLLTDIGFSDLMSSAIFIPVWFIAYLAFFLIKKYVIKPRIGIIKPGHTRKTKLQKANVVLLIILFAGLLIGFFYNEYTTSINFLFPISFSVIILLVSFVSAYYFDINRFYYYGILIAAAPLIGEILWANRLVSHHGFPLLFGMISLGLIVTGLTLFIRFIKSHPVVEIEE